MQKIAPKTVKFGAEAFNKIDYTSVRWLGNAGALVNSRGTSLMIDPVLSGFDMKLLIDMPILEKDIPHLDALLITHSDNDHYGRATAELIKDKTDEFHSTKYVASLFESELSIKGTGHDIGESFNVSDVKVTLTPALHNWQNEYLENPDREYLPEDCCGFWIDTPDGSIWAVGDSKLLDSQLNMPTPDAILFDFSDSSWHIGLDNAVRLAAAYPDTPLILWHWGSVDAPNMKEFNGDPDELKALIVNPERALVLAPGQEYRLEPLKK